MPWHLRRNRRAVELPFGGKTVRVPTLEDLVVYKLVASRPRDVDDVEKLLAIHPSIADEEIRATLKDFAEVLGRPEILQTLEELLS